MLHQSNTSLVVQKGTNVLRRRQRSNSKLRTPSVNVFRKIQRLTKKTTILFWESERESYALLYISARLYVFACALVYMINMLCARAM